MASLVLNKPILINGEEVRELNCNLEDMTARDKAEATKAFKKAGNMIMVQELDADYHLYLFAAAVHKENSSIEVDDVLRMSAKDSVKAEALVRDFFFLSSGE
ncbi:phage tail assembly protein [Gorillibacterium massiliense]|uniref:phage tail assembly protein n=1 Tax=Gorillibacterium massiliense TaxID=1280390 RepID=UPI0004ADA82C|nr:phage tail assembly protein [Gorillibacterium massiliense]